MEDQEVVHHLPDAEPDSLARRKIKNDRVVQVGALKFTTSPIFMLHLILLLSFPMYSKSEDEEAQEEEGPAEAQEEEGPAEAVDRLRVHTNF